jgi:hypothetical protein
MLQSVVWRQSCNSISGELRNLNNVYISLTLAQESQQNGRAQTYLVHMFIFYDSTYSNFQNLPLPCQLWWTLNMPNIWVIGWFLNFQYHSKLKLVTQNWPKSQYYTPTSKSHPYSCNIVTCLLEDQSEPTNSRRTMPLLPTKFLTFRIQPNTLNCSVKNGTLLLCTTVRANNQNCDFKWLQAMNVFRAQLLPVSAPIEGTWCRAASLPPPWLAPAAARTLAPTIRVDMPILLPFLYEDASKSLSQRK